MIKEVKSCDPGYGNNRLRAAFAALTVEFQKTQTPLIFEQGETFQVDWQQGRVTFHEYYWIHDGDAGDGCRHGAEIFPGWDGCYQCFVDGRKIRHKSTGRGYTRDVQEAVADTIRFLETADERARKARQRREAREEKAYQKRYEEIQRRINGRY